MVETASNGSKKSLTPDLNDSSNVESSIGNSSPISERDESLENNSSPGGKRKSEFNIEPGFSPKRSKTEEVDESVGMASSDSADELGVFEQMVVDENGALSTADDNETISKCDEEKVSDSVPDDAEALTERNEETTADQVGDDKGQQLTEDGKVSPADVDDNKGR